MKKKLTAAVCLLLSVMIMLSSQIIPAGAVIIDDFSFNYDPFFYGRYILSQMENGNALVYTYDRLSECILSASSGAELDYDRYPISTDQVDIVYKLVAADHPECFWFKSISYSYGFDDIVYSITPTYTLSQSQIAAAEEQVQERARELCAGLEGLSDYEISLELHDRLSYAVKYVSTNNDQNIYGALVEGKAVCAGYAASYQYLMKLMGIPAYKITGSSKNPSTGYYLGHAWNMVLLDGEWYLTDVTWDDHDTDSGMIYHEYLNGTTEQFDKTHTVYSDIVDYLPVCSATKNNYFIRNNLVISGYDMKRVAISLVQNSLCADFLLSDDVVLEDYIADFQNSLYDLADYLKVSGSMSYGYRRLDREVVLVFNASTDPVTYTLDIGTNTEVSNISPSPICAALKLDGIPVYNISSVDPAGTLCIENVLPGEYTLEVYRNDFVSYTKDIEITDSTSLEAKIYRYGDVNLDGRLNLADSFCMKLLLLNMYTSEDMDTVKLVADIKRDGKLNPADLFSMKSLLLGGTAGN